MNTDPLHEYARLTRRFLDGHWVVRWFVVPIVSMGLVLFVALLGTFEGTLVEYLAVVGLFLAGSFLVVLLAVGVEKVAAMLLAE